MMVMSLSLAEESLASYFQQDNLSDANIAELAELCRLSGDQPKLQFVQIVADNSRIGQCFDSSGYHVAVARWDFAVTEVLTGTS
jgi:hypothetical protein